MTENARTAPREDTPSDLNEPVADTAAATSAVTDAGVSPKAEASPSQEAPVAPKQTETPVASGRPEPAKLNAAADPAGPKAEPKLDLKAESKVPPATPGKPLATTDFGIVDESGVVWVQDGDVTREVGSYPEGVPEDPFALYVRRYLDLAATINLFEARLPTLPAKDIDATVKTLKEQLREPAVVGNIPALRTQLDRLITESKARKEELSADRKRAREEALAARTKVVEQAEEIAAQPADRTQWKQSGQRLRELLDEWRNLQRKGPRLDKSAEDKLWKRFSAARTTFDRGRRQFFAALDQRQKEARAEKESLIAKAEALQGSDDWRGTSAAYRDLMEQWKRAGRASRREDDELWARFRAAQQVFFDNRRAHDRAVDEEFGDNLARKQELAAEAEALLPITDIEVTKTKLRSIQDRWEEVGQVPSREASRIEGRLKAVEGELREAENREWRRSDPETKARASGMLQQLEDSIADLKKQLAAAEKAGDKKRVKEVGDALATKEMWYQQISSSMK